MDEFSRRFAAQHETMRFLPDRSKRKLRGSFLESFYCHLVAVLFVNLGQDCWKWEYATDTIVELQNFEFGTSGGFMKLWMTIKNGSRIFHQ
jgi:hypothetical protein